MTLPPIDETIRPGPNHNLDFIDLDELRKKSGSMPSDILRWSLQEMLCNSLDTDANTIEVIVKTVGPYDVITVKDNGTRKITFDDLCLILDFCNKASSKRGLLRVTRGTHGNALKCLFGYSYALAKAAKFAPPNTRVSSQGKAFNINLVPKSITQNIGHEITTNIISEKINAFTFKFPVNHPTMGLHKKENREKVLREARRLEELIHSTGMVNPTRRITYDFWGFRKGIVNEAGEPEILKKDTSVLWYEVSEFTELLYDFIRARPETQLKEFVALFRGFTGKKVIREILHTFNESSNHDSQIEDAVHFSPSTLIKVLSQQDVERLYRILRARAKPISKRSTQHVLGCVGLERFEEHRERQGWANLKYVLLKDRVEPNETQRVQATFPFLIELAIFDRDPNDAEGPKIYQCVNFMASKLPLFRIAHDVNSRLVQVGITEHTPVTVVIHLVSPVQRWLNFAKTSIGGKHIGELLKRAFNKLLPIPKKPKAYMTKKPAKPVSWVPRGKITTKKYREKLKPWADTLKFIDSQRGDILPKLSGRGWGYLLEGLHKIDKDDFDACNKAINDCIKLGYLSIDFTAKDQDPTRSFRGIHEVSDPSVLLEDIKKSIDDVLYILPHHTTDYWEGEEFYLMMCVEKIDIYNLFDPICREYNVPIVNSKGWYTLKPRYTIAELSRKAEERGLKPVLLLFYDHDITGLEISRRFRKGLRDMIGQTKWDPSNLIIDRFGLNYKDIEKHELTWIPNLKSSSGNDPDIRRKEVREYIRLYGKRKCEANALTRNDDTLRIGQQLCRDAIEKYYSEDALDRFARKRERAKEELVDIYDNSVWKDFQSALDNIIGLYEKKDEKRERFDPEKEYDVEIYQKLSKGNYLYGKCPVCGTLFDYERDYIGRLVRCRQCNVSMKLKYIDKRK